MPDRPSDLAATARRYLAGAGAVGRSLTSPRGRPAAPTEPVAAPSVPAGWTIGPPDFVGVGTARSGTTWWDSLIHAHPDVARAEGVPKEVHFFDRFWRGDCTDEDMAAYHGFFARPVGARAGEWTPGYMLDAWTPPLLRRAAPDARLLVLLRDPVERYRSGRTLAEGRLTVGASARAAANAGFQRGVYADQLLRLWRAFPRQQVLVLQFERCVREPRAALERTFRFLGLDPAPAATMEVSRVVNESRGPKVDLGVEQRTTLVARYAPENRRLAALLGDDLDLSLWASPR